MSKIKYNIIKYGLFALWLGGIVALWCKYDWKTAGACWVISCCFGAGVLMEVEKNG